MRISDWGSDVCSSDLRLAPALEVHQQHAGIEVVGAGWHRQIVVAHEEKVARRPQHPVAEIQIPPRRDIVEIGRASCRERGVTTFRYRGWRSPSQNKTKIITQVQLPQYT